ncbi:amidase [Mycena belliarum]|uniref:Amidase n=1 Tax=Mycena belliarum TaxID=1033014 RepID=A0AAD6UCY4_9AGAR|nr:amidase [Mycena belliae]
MNLFPLFMSSAVPAAPAKRAFRDQALEDEAQRASPVDSPTTSCRIDPETVVRSTAQEIVAGIARGTWTASQVLEVFIAQSLIAHAATNCITEVLFDFARKRATQLDVGFLKTGCVMGPLHGVPISVKDQCYRVLGAVTKGLYNADCTPGGSSGGEACMLALDASVIGLGSDIGGSLRIPAAYCGVYSLKPGCGRISNYGAKDSFPGFDGIKSAYGPMARCMDDLELACRVSFGARGAFGEVPPVPFRDADLPKILRFGYYTSDGIIKASPACIRAVKTTVEALQEAGHECLALNLEDIAPEILDIFLNLTAADGYKNLLKEVGSDPLETSLSVLTFGPKVPQPIRDVAGWAIERFAGDKVMGDILRGSGTRTVEKYHAICLRRNDVKNRFCREFWDKYELDGIITYVHASPQTLHDGSKMLSMMSAPSLTYNLVDSPAGVVPVTYVDAETDKLTQAWTDGPGHGSPMCERELYFKGKKPLYDPGAMHGMPVGVQVVGRLWEDEKVLAMMRVVDDALGKERGFAPGTWGQRLKNRGGAQKEAT